MAETDKLEYFYLKVLADKNGPMTRPQMTAMIQRMSALAATKGFAKIMGAPTKGKDKRTGSLEHRGYVRCLAPNKTALQYEITEAGR
jgi:hypothetical protein